MAVVWKEVSGPEWLRSEKIRNILAGRHKPNRKIKKDPNTLSDSQLDKLGPRGTFEAPESSIILTESGGIVIPQGSAIRDNHDLSDQARPTIQCKSTFPEDGVALDWVRARKGQGNGRECSYWVWIDMDRYGQTGVKVHGDQESIHHKGRVNNLPENGIGFWLVSPSHSCVLDTCAVIGYVAKGDSEEFVTPDGDTVRIKVPARNATGYKIGGAYTGSSVVTLQNCYAHNVQYGISCDRGNQITTYGDRMEDVSLPYDIHNVDRVTIQNIAFNQSCGRDGLLGIFDNVRHLEFSGIIDRALFSEAHIIVNGEKVVVTRTANKIGVIDYKL